MFPQWDSDVEDPAAENIINVMFNQRPWKWTMDCWEVTGLNCEYIENLKRPNCVVTNELASFWEKLGVDIEAGPSTEQITTSLGRCEGWSRDDRKRLGYLAIFAGYIEGRKGSTPTRASLARLVMELERFENYPWGRVAFKVLMDSVKGKDITGCYTIDEFVQALRVRVYTARRIGC
ncbi:hypothetical protein Bca52824_001272 [Brassica carinata]|uniref:DUF1985 domain-containing protein n=1 Tax=Brassica carinata TaxID=52824 RepID=A0A8X7WIS0_BRACI|nr:hypothetical protein Bca52824_001272 [Brassica carinata]